MQELIDFAQALQVAAKAAQLYSPVHPRCIDAIAALVQATEKLFGERRRLQIVASGGQLFMERKPVEKVTPHVAALSKQLQERKISGFVLNSGVTERDLRALVEVLTTRPQRVEELGGAAQMLTDAGVTLIRVSHVRYEELREGEEVVDSTSVVHVGDDRDAAALLNEIFRPMLRAMKSGDKTLAQPSPRTDAEAVAEAIKSPSLDVNQLEAKLGATGAASDADFERALTATLMELSPEAQARLVASQSAMQPGVLRHVVENAAPAIVMQIVSALAQQDASASGPLPDIAARLMAQLSSADRSLERLRQRLESLGVDQDQLSDLLTIVAWEGLSLEDKIQWIAQGRHMFELPGERTVAFLRELLEQGRDEFATLLERYGLALQADSAEMRRVVIDNFARIVAWGSEIPFNPAQEATLQRTLLTHFLREPDQRVQQRSIAAVSALVGQWIAIGRSDKATRALNTLFAGTTAAATETPWKRQAYEALIAAVAKEHIRPLAEQISTRDLDALSTDVYPLLALLGARAATELIDQLADENDRGRRGRIIRAIKAIGRSALLPLRHSLASTTWYLVRNTLNILGDLGAVELIEEVGLTLKHEDSRVRRAAARALREIGGTRAEELLIAELGSADAELQTEVLYCLGQMKAASAVLPLGDLLKSRRGSDEFRERAVETLGAIGSADAIPILEDVIKKRGLLASTDASIRAAAAKALAQISSRA